VRVDRREPEKESKAVMTEHDPIPGLIYRHQKTGDMYECLDTNVRYEPTAEWCVAYRRKDQSDLTVWVRPLDVFLERFEVVVE